MCWVSSSRFMALWVRPIADCFGGPPDTDRISVEAGLRVEAMGASELRVVRFNRAWFLLVSE